MSELQRILQTAEEARREGADGILATVVNVRGSVYRRAGARLLATENGLLVGGVSGGCLENDVIERQRRVLQNNAPELVTYDTSSTSEDLVWGLGLGCNGLVEVLIEPLRSRSVERYLRFVRNEKNAASVAVVIRSNNETYPVGLRSFASLDEEKNVICSDIEFLSFHQKVCAEGRSRTFEYTDDKGSYEIFCEPLTKPTRIILCGAGNDAVPVAETARMLDWEVVLVDSRQAFATNERFPNVTRIIQKRPEFLSEHIAVESRDAFVIMTHNYQLDSELLPLALKSDAFYVGALGPRRRTEQILADLEKNGTFRPNKEQMAKLHAPIGLDIGSETPAEIALSVVSEIQAKTTQRLGGFLRERKSSIH